MKGYCHFCGEYTDLRKITFTDEEDIDLLGRGYSVIYVCADSNACHRRREEYRRKREEEEKRHREEAAEIDKLLSGLIRVYPFRFDPETVQRIKIAGVDVAIGTVNGHKAITVQYGATSGTFYYASPEANLAPYKRESVLDDFFGD